MKDNKHMSKGNINDLFPESYYKRHGLKTSAEKMAFHDRMSLDDNVIHGKFGVRAHSFHCWAASYWRCQEAKNR